MAVKSPTAHHTLRDLEWDLLGRSNPKKGRLRSIFTRDMWFILMLLLIVVSIFIPAYRLNLLLASLFSALGLAWINYRESRVRKKVKRFREEMIYVKSVEAVKNYSGVKSELQKLLGKYRDIPEFSDFIKSAIREIEIKIHHLPRPDVFQDSGPVPEKKPEPEAKTAVKERRKSPRVETRIVLDEVVNFNADSVQSRDGGTMVNLSTGGALIKTSGAFDVKPGDTVSVNQIDLNGALRFEAIFGKVIHLKDRPGERWIGIEFVYLEDREREKLDKYLVSILN